MNLDLKALYPFWDTINDDQKKLIVESVKSITFKTGDIVKLKDVTRKNGLIVVVSGFLRLYLSDNGREITISELRDGDAFCILTIDDAGKNDAMPDLQAREDTVIAYLNVSVLEVLSGENRSVASFLFKTAVSSAQNILNSVSHHFFNNLRSCLAKFIVDNVGNYADDCPVLRITHEQLANNLGTSRVVVSRELEFFNEQGIIKTGRGRIEVINLKKLNHIAGYTKN